MTKKYAENLRNITGTVVIDFDGEERLCCLEDMQFTKAFSIGQLFNAVRVLNGKSAESYGKLWPRYSADTSPNTLDSTEDTDGTSQGWKVLKAAMAACESDYEMLTLVCNQLQEEVPVIVPKAKVQERLNMFKENMF